ncbi:MAG: Trm112 family protein [Thermogutta sp.]
MVDAQLLAILACPETRQPLKTAEPALLVAVNEAIAAGRVSNRAGQPIRDPVEELLVREDGAVAYPVREEIPVLLIDEGIPLEGLAPSQAKG